jgi:hypothetical protein
MRGSSGLSRCVSGERSPIPGRLCDFLSRQGYVAVEVGEDEAEILITGARSSFEAAAMVMSEVGIWRAKQTGVQVSVETQR